MSIPQDLEAMLYEVRNALYGQEVRENIADSLEYVYETAETFKDASAQSAEEAQEAAEEIQESAAKIDDLESAIKAVTENDQSNLINEAYLLNASGCIATDGVYSAMASALYNAFSKNGREFPVDFEWEPSTKYTFGASVKNGSNAGSADGLLFLFYYSDDTYDRIPIKRNITNWFEVVLSSNPEKTVSRFSISY